MDAIWLVLPKQLLICKNFIVALPQIVEMIREYLQVSHSTRGETEELERLASQLTLSETPKQVCELDAVKATI